MKLLYTLLATLAVSPSATAMEVTSVRGKNLSSVQQDAAAKKDKGDESSSGGGAALRKTNLPVNIARDASDQQVYATCSGDDNFTMEGFFDSSYDGCYSVATNLAEHNEGLGSFVYDGQSTDGWYFIGTDQEGELDNYIWTISEGTFNTMNNGIDFVVACYDSGFNAALDVHPTLVTDWDCSWYGQNSTSFSLTCGCPTTGEDAPSVGATDDGATDGSENEEDSADMSSSAAAASGFTFNSVVFSATAGKVIVGLVASILGSVVFL